MGTVAAIAGLASTAIGGLYSHKQQKKANAESERAAAAMADAMKKAPTVQTAQVAAQQEQTAQKSEQIVNSDAKRRAAISSTVNTPGSAMASLGGRKTLG